MKTPHATAAEVADIIKAVPSFLRSQAKQSYDLVVKAQDPQAVLNALPDFGITATQALGIYSAMYGALDAIGQADGLSAPDLEMFAPQPDGTVLFVAPPEPEIEEAPEP